MEGVDYSLARPNLDELWRAGKRFVSRYLAYLPNDKVLTFTELRRLHDRGFGVVLNWEQATGDMLKGFNTGKAHASEALRQANALDAPSNTPIYFSCDLQVTEAQFAPVARYLDGAASVLGRHRVGVYGQYSLIQALVPTVATWGWQTYAWSAGKVSPKAHFLQYHNNVKVGGGDCDLNRSLKAEFGAWYKGGMDVALDQNDLNAIAQAVWTHPLGQGNPGYAGQQGETALAFAWQSGNTAVEKLDEVLSKLGAQGTGTAMTDEDRVLLHEVRDAVHDLNNRLATP